MSSAVAAGWEVFNAVAAGRIGRLCVVGMGYWASDNGAGFTGFDGIPTSYGVNTYYRADSVRTTLAMVKWLTGKTSGANILLMQEDPPNSGYPFQAQFQSALTDAGHTITHTGSGASWEGFEPLDYDLLIGQPSVTLFSYHGLTSAQDKWDYILANRGVVLSETETTGNVWIPYGIDANAYHYRNTTTGHYVHYGPNGNERLGPDVTNSVSPGSWNGQRPFTCEQFGDPGTGGSWNTNYYALVLYAQSSIGLKYASPPANQRGGTRVIVPCVCEAVGNHGVNNDNLGVIGLWWET